MSRLRLKQIDGKIESEKCESYSKFVNVLVFLDQLV